MKYYKVGGCVRDEVMGVQSKDIDYVCVADDISRPVNDLFNEMYTDLLNKGYEIFLSTPDCFTIRAKLGKETSDFVLARKEIGYIDGTRKPILVAGTLYDDLVRRDFTVNAIAEDDEGNYRDFFGGIEDIKNSILRTPLSAEITFNEDPLRILRAIRFSITKGFKMNDEIIEVIHYFDYESKFKVVSTERIREELTKCFKADTLTTLKILSIFVKLRDYIFKTNIWLKPTTKL